MPSRKEIFSHIKNLEIQKTSKKGLIAKKMWSGQEQGVEFRVARVDSRLDSVVSLIIAGEGNPTCLTVGIRGESEEKVKRMRKFFVSAFGKPLQLKTKDSSENLASSKPQETVVWIEKEALANEDRKPKPRFSTTLFKR